MSTLGIVNSLAKSKPHAARPTNVCVSESVMVGRCTAKPIVHGRCMCSRTPRMDGL